MVRISSPRENVLILIISSKTFSHPQTKGHVASFLLDCTLLQVSSQSGATLKTNFLGSFFGQSLVFSSQYATWLCPTEQKTPGSPISCESAANGVHPLFNFKQAVRDTSTQAPPYCVSSYYLPTSSFHLCMSRLFLLSQCVIFRHLPCALGGVSWSKHLQGNLNFQNCTIIIARPKKCMLVKGLLMKCLGLLTFNDPSSQADTRLLLGPVRFPGCRAPVCLSGSVLRLKGR